MISYIFFAKWFGVISVLLSLGILFNMDEAKQMAKHMVDGQTGYVMGGVQPIIFGSFAFIHYWYFHIGWQLVVTIIGFMMMMAGAYRVLFVNHWRKTMRRHIDKIPPLFSLFGLMLGLLLLYVGFLAPLLYDKPVV